MLYASSSVEEAAVVVSLSEPEEVEVLVSRELRRVGRGVGPESEGEGG